MDFESHWGLSNLIPIPTSTNNKVFVGKQGTRSIVLKLTRPQEIDALKAFAQYGAIRILDHTENALLLEHVGESLKSYFPNRDLEAIQITCDLIQKLHQAPLPASKFPHIRDWLKILDQNWNIPEDHLKKARELRDQLLSTYTQDVLLHGDLHHDNILQNGDTWMAIDPHGVIGDPTYEVAAFIRNPIPDLINHPDMLPTRILEFSRMLNFDPKRIQDWCFVQAILAWAWALEDGGDVTYFKHLTVELAYHLSVFF